MVDVFPVCQPVPDRERLVGYSDPDRWYVQCRQSARATFPQVLIKTSKPHRGMVPMGRGLWRSLRRTFPVSSSQRSRIQRGSKARRVLQPSVLDRSDQNLFDIHHHDEHNKHNESNHFRCSAGPDTVSPNNIKPGTNRSAQRSSARHAQAIFSKRRRLASRLWNDQQ